MSRDADTLATLLAHAQRQRDTALAAARKAEQQERQARAQADQLRQWRGHYDQRWTDHFREAGDRSLLDCRHAFGQRLDDAVRLQSTEAGHLRERADRAQQTVREREQRVAAVRKLMERREKQRRHEEDRREQRQHDELGAQLVRRQTPALGRRD